MNAFKRAGYDSIVGGASAKSVTICKIYSNGATQFTDWDPLRNASDEMIF